MYPLDGPKGATEAPHEPEKSAGDATGPDTVAPVQTIEERWSNAAELARQHNILCTGGPGDEVCGNPGQVCVILHTRLFSVPCREHVEGIVREIMRRGHGACRFAPIDVMLEQHGQRFVNSCAAMRERMHMIGFELPLGDFPPHRR
jgi:hypothetical protein